MEELSIDRIISGFGTTACAFRGTKVRRDDAIFSAFSFGKSEFMLRSRMVRIRARGDKEAEEIFALGGSPQPVGKARFGQGNQRKSKPFSLISFAWALLDLARFG
jgi:hypothetical protein